MKDLGEADPLVIRAAVSVVALARGERKLGADLVWFDTSELAEFVDTQAPWRIADEPTDA